MKAKLMLAFLLGQSFLVQMTSCQQKTDRERVVSTTRQVITCLQNGDKEGFVALNKHSIRQNFKTKKMIENDFEIWRKEFDRTFNVTKGMFIIDDSIDQLGRLKVTIPLREYKDSLKIKGYLFYGPPQFVPLNQITSYEIEVQYKTTPKLVPIK